ncbi:MAG TPA: HlyC/CorC family transporter [Geminicoccaceae bacterium]|nr:HlyC/CorC family transporter [Geminicoccaceae bacterium]
MLYLTVAVGILLLLSAFTSGTETAMTGASRARIHHLAGAGDRRAELVRRLLERKENLIGSLLLGNNFFNVLATALAADILIQLFGEVGVAYATLIMTALLVIFAEVLPKTYAIRNPERMALFIAPFAQLLVLALTPLTRFVQWMVNRVLSLFGVPAQPDPLSSSVDALRGTIALHAEEGAVQKQERDMLGGILDLAEVAVREIMTHRSSMETIDAGRPPAEILEQVVRSPYSRFPVWRYDPDRIIGVLHAKDLLDAVREHGRRLDGLDVTVVCSPAWFVPDTTPLRQQLVAFRKQRQHLALVVDEYGDLEGLVTLEDVIEEIVGEIADEKDVESSGIEPQSDGSVLVGGWVTVRDLNRHLDWRLPDEDAATIAGLVIHEAQRLPEVGQSFAFHGFRFEVLRRQRNRIALLKVVPRPAAATDN